MPRWGDIHTRIPASASPPPAAQTFDNVRFYFPNGFEPTITLIAQLYHGSSGSTTGFYTNKTTFLSDHPGLNLETLEITPPPSTQPVPASFTGFTQAFTGDSIDQSLFDSTHLGTPWDVWYMEGTNGYVQLTFSPAINSFGFNWGSSPVLVEWRDGTTVLHSATGVSGSGIATQFMGYSSAS